MVIMPTRKCENCGTDHYGWALLFMKCYCDCGYWLNWDLYGSDCMSNHDDNGKGERCDW